MACHNSTRTQLIQRHSMFLWSGSGCFTIEVSGMSLICIYLKRNLIRNPIKGEGKYMHSKIKTWKERIKTNFRDQDVLYDMYCKAKVLLKNEIVYKQNKSYHPQVNVEECKNTDAES